MAQAVGLGSGRNYENKKKALAAIAMLRGRAGLSTRPRDDSGWVMPPDHHVRRQRPALGLLLDRRHYLIPVTTRKAVGRITPMSARR